MTKLQKTKAKKIKHTHNYGALAGESGQLLSLPFSDVDDMIEYDNGEEEDADDITGW